MEEFTKAGFTTLDEAFLDMPSYCSLHPQSLLMETNWICGWFQRILKEASRAGNNPDKTLLVVDRSPLSAVFYTRNNNGLLLAPIIAAQIKELREVNIEVFTVHVRCDTNVLWRRIQKRLTIEPDRAMYKEDSFEWLLEVKNFYDHFQGWDFTVDNSSDDTSLLKSVSKEILDAVSTKSPKLRDARRMFLESDVPCKRIILDDPALVS